MDRFVRDALGRLDVDEVAAQLLDQVDLTQLVLDRVDLGRVVAGSLDPLDLTSIIVDQVNLGGVARTIALPVNSLLSRAPRLRWANGNDPE